ncbi:MAG: L-aspartate oxidase, partial [Phycisphaerales bacterium]|nr:L-aspartate oxidase [Phycisphaerales bacterium]
IFCDTLVLGSGVAGLRAAIGASKSGQVTVCAKESLNLTNTSWAQGGIAGVLDEHDSIESHIEDTMTAGAGMCDPEAIELVCRQGPDHIREIIDWGMKFDLNKDGELNAGREGGHTASRVYHAGGDATGVELQRTLIEQTTARENIRLFDHCFVIDLLTSSNTPGAPVLGAMTWHPKYGLQVIWARTTILAMGGAGQVYRETSNPRVATADGIAMAYRAGAQLADMEFVQFHPTTLYIPGAARALISEAVRGEGAHLLDHSGQRFMPDIHPLAELAPRDVVASAIVRQLAIQGGKHVWLDCRHIKNFPTRFPGIHATLKSFELDPAKDLIPVHPAAHYTIGGVRTDLRSRTSIPNLLAVGEVSCTGLHGANRLASNSLLEGLVMGAIAGEEAANRADTNPVSPSSIVSRIEDSNHAELDLDDVRSSLRSTMWFNAGIERTLTKLDDACDMFDLWGRYTLDKVFELPDGWEVQNMLTASALIARAALARTQSIGTHTLTNTLTDSDQNTGLTEHHHTIWIRGAGKPVFASSISDFDAIKTESTTPQPEPGTNVGVSKN